jgi:hypothetical protein
MREWCGGADVGRGNRAGPMKWVRVPERLDYDAPVGSNQPLWRPHRSSGTVASRPPTGRAGYPPGWTTRRFNAGAFRLTPGPGPG